MSTLGGEKLAIKRDEITKMYHCPCGAPEHSRASISQFAYLFKKPEHPTPTTSEGLVPIGLQLDVPEPIEDTPDVALLPVEAAPDNTEATNIDIDIAEDELDELEDEPEDEDDHECH